jgi:hypothetical protein
VEFVLALAPVAACAALMVVCFRGMRHSETESAGPEETAELLPLRRQLDALRGEVATLRAELDRERSGAIGNGTRRP